MYQRTMDLRTHTSVSFKGATLTTNLVPPANDDVDRYRCTYRVSSLPKKARVPQYKGHRAMHGWKLEEQVVGRKRYLSVGGRLTKRCIWEMNVDCCNILERWNLVSLKQGSHAVLMQSASSATSKSSQSCSWEKIDYCGLFRLIIRSQLSCQTVRVPAWLNVQNFLSILFPIFFRFGHWAFSSCTALKPPFLNSFRLPFVSASMLLADCVSCILPFGQRFHN